jgi:hypothetical protein
VVEQYSATNMDEMSIEIGEVLVQKDADEEWLLCEKVDADAAEIGASGWVPKGYVKPAVLRA